LFDQVLAIAVWKAACLEFRRAGVVCANGERLPIAVLSLAGVLSGQVHATAVWKAAGLKVATESGRTMAGLSESRDDKRQDKNGTTQYWLATHLPTTFLSGSGTLLKSYLPFSPPCH
jgi:hypothetical protein